MSTIYRAPTPYVASIPRHRSCANFLYAGIAVIPDIQWTFLMLVTKQGLLLEPLIAAAILHPFHVLEPIHVGVVREDMPLD